MIVCFRKLLLTSKRFQKKSYDDKPLLYDPESECHANEETIEVVEESMRGEYAGVADCSSFESFKKSLGIWMKLGFPLDSRKISRDMNMTMRS